MQRFAMSWLVYSLTNSALLLGVVGFTSQIPMFLATPFGGVLADRWNRHRILIVTQSLAMIQAFTLAFLVLTRTIAVWQIVCLSVFLGLVDSLDMPARQSFVVEMVEKREDLGNAIALNSSMVNGARLLGPSIAGVLIAYMGEGMCFLFNALSYLAVILSLLAMKITPRKVEIRNPRILQGVKEGISYAFGFIPIRSLLLLVAVVSLMGVSHVVLMPVFARDILRGDSHTLGFLMGCSGMGAMVGVAFLTSRRSIVGLEKWSARATAMFGSGLILFSFSRSFWLSLFLMTFTGFGMMVQQTSSNTVMQATVDEDKRGRVMSLYTLAFRGMMPFGSLFAGTLASQIGAPNTILIGGGCCLLGSLLFARKLPLLEELIRPIYAKTGIMAEEGSRMAEEKGQPKR